MKRVLIPAVAALVAVGGFAALRGSSSEGSPDDEAMQAGAPAVTEAAAEGAGEPVTADQVWDETLEAMGCLRDDGIQVQGPVPSSSGLGVWYGTLSTAATEAETEAAEDRCTAELAPLAQRFALANGSEEGPDGQAVPATAEGQRLVAIADQLKACLVNAGITLAEPDGDADWPLTKAAQDHPADYEACVAQV